MHGESICNGQLELTVSRAAICRSHGLREEHCRFFYQQIILALDYCHKMSISNRDIKLENTLLDSTDPDRNPLIKLCDFGYSINESQSLPKTAVGTPGYTGRVHLYFPSPKHCLLGFSCTGCGCLPKCRMRTERLLP